MKKLAVFWLLAFFMATTRAETVVLDANESPPYWSKKLPFNGLGGEIIAAISQAAGLESQIHFMPLKRLIENTQNNDLGNPAFYMENQEFAAIIPIAISQVSLYSYKSSEYKSPIHFKSIKDLKGYRVGVLSGSIVNRDQFEQLGVLVETSYSQESLFKKLHHGRLDFVLEIDLIGQQMITKLFPNEVKNFTTIPLPRSVSPIAIMLDKNYPNAELIAQRYQQGLAEIIKNGRYSDILKTYYLQKPSESWFKELTRFTQMYQIQKD